MTSGSVEHDVLVVDPPPLVLHLSLPPVLCDQCDQRFVDENSMKTHVNRVQDLLCADTLQNSYFHSAVTMGQLERGEYREVATK